MKLKKFNAVIALLTILFVLVHIGYNVYCYMTFYYNPIFTKITAIPIMISACIHGICGMTAVFLQGDGTSLNLYPKQNIKTVIQRISAALIFPMLILHLNTMNILTSSAEEEMWGRFVIVIVGQVLFYAVIIVHTAVSFSKALITLGILTSPGKQKKLDKISYIAGVIFFAISAFSIVKTQISMFCK